MKEKLKSFLDDRGRLTAFPAKRKMKIVALFYLAGKFESGRIYSEMEINSILLDWHTFGDPATLRRELYDYYFLDRSVDSRSYQLSSKPPKPEDFDL
ncbi:MAG: DUF2087 domain-containing protein [Oscillibacter sp.]|nr:DUF2087 domain-containing protein [Oscillospiraceae bacterium]MBR5471706.1 DUF2087 domain-containing protein [Oscillibacter sp.]